MTKTKRLKRLMFDHSPENTCYLDKENDAKLGAYFFILVTEEYSFKASLRALLKKIKKEATKSDLIVTEGKTLIGDHHRFEIGAIAKEIKLRLSTERELRQFMEKCGVKCEII